ncbi:DUF2382 domain-containing protein [Jatrophihabitans lederbergiae]|uniref:DUF2382 domain-containing protein n=1 Tax=Jatrophihabitans lederbergiae TaxID=3075547 RepID=A0ABU2J9Q6_9ACTN|nr:DUF2382 domain-containing protein [Jatrophihabitans sp. DSM 44399]MDT0261717.1 DUF2382 domain-containing protein [Jatrophihabitans sp. DSM 44399]
MNTPRVPDERLTGDERIEQSDAAMTVSAEQVYVDTEWTVSGRVRLRRQIETRTETIQVTLRREVLVVDTEDTVGDDGAIVGVAADNLAVGAPGPVPEPIVLVLREEVPEVSVQIRPYELVSTDITRTSREHPVTATARREQVVLEGDTGA